MMLLLMSRVTNRKHLEPLAPRYMAVKRDGCVEMSVKRVPAGITSVSVPMHPRNAKLGDRVLHISNSVLIEAEVSHHTYCSIYLDRTETYTTAVLLRSTTNAYTNICY
jgi:glutamyl/glutaminyl-tRNA synthetase